MKQNKFSKLENNYYYGISRLFWHIIIALGSLAIIVGLGVLIWSQIPAHKNKVVKANSPTKKSYPKPVAVSLNELKNLLPKGAELTKEKNNVIQIVESENRAPDIVENKNIRDTIGLSKFNAEIDILKTLIPVGENRVLWEGQGYYAFNNARDEKMFKKTKRENLRHWISTSKSFDIEFIKKTDKHNLESYVDKATLLKAYNYLLQNIHKQNRASLLRNNLIRFYKNKKGLKKSVHIVETISETLKHINLKEQLSAFQVLERFTHFNPKDGIGLQKFQQSILQKFESNQRLNVIKTINKEYTKHYNNKLASIIENTDQFTPMLSNFKGDQQPVALKYFYSLYRGKNGNRNQQIQQIENDFTTKLREIDRTYKNDLIEAKADLQIRQQKKTEMKSLSYKSMLYGLGVVLLISLILLVLSMIRNVNRLAEAMLQNNKTNFIDVK